ncbi:MAG: ABC transporter ATP-binding protein [Chitinophagales bacterium]
MNSFAVQIANLEFHYPGQSSFFIDHLNLEIAVGERFGLFGPNAAGKTTLMNLMTGLNSYDKGSVRLLGHEVSSRDKNIFSLFGLVPQDLSFYEELSPAENLEFFGAWAGLDRQEIRSKTKELLDILGLAEFRNKPVGRFSGGMKRRLNLAIAVMNNPRILFLDEPTVGVDVQTRHAIIDYLKKLNREGTTLVYTSHQLGEAEELCERIALMDEGKIIVHDDLDQLISQHQQEGLEGLFLYLTGKAFRD